MGELQPLVSKNAKIIEDKLIHRESSVFNKNNYAKISPQVGQYGLYYLIIRPNYKLVDLDYSPEELQTDIYYGHDKALIYGFYNPTALEAITIRCRIVVDSDNTHQKLKSNPDDIFLRIYFLECAKKSNSISKFDKTRELADDAILTAEEAADLIGITKKTLQNYASDGAVKKLRGGKYKKSDIDFFMQQNKSKKKK
jgi:hypothetical protein